MSVMSVTGVMFMVMVMVMVMVMFMFMFMWVVSVTWAMWSLTGHIRHVPRAPLAGLVRAASDPRRAGGHVRGHLDDARRALSRGLSRPDLKRLSLSISEG
eukprot:6659788-Prymnesium_polylepis.2